MDSAMSLELDGLDFTAATDTPLHSSWFSSDADAEIATHATLVNEIADYPKSLSLKLGPTPTRTFSFTFPDAITPSLRPSAPQSPPRQLSPSPAPDQQTTPTAERKPTRIKPPGDIIKLEDRLYYLL